MAVNYWQLEEDMRLLEEVREGKSIAEIAQAHGRTERAIGLRLERHARTKMQGLPVEDVHDATGIPLDILNKVVEADRKRAENPPAPRGKKAAATTAPAPDPRVPILEAQLGQTRAELELLRSRHSELERRIAALEASSQ